MLHTEHKTEIRLSEMFLGLRCLWLGNITEEKSCLFIEIAGMACPLNFLSQFRYSIQIHETNSAIFRPIV
jgi:hypothetical protein